jgi:hypothetical protein
VLDPCPNPSRSVPPDRGCAIAACIPNGSNNEDAPSADAPFSNPRRLSPGRDIWRVMATAFSFVLNQTMPRQFVQL